MKIKSIVSAIAFAFSSIASAQTPSSTELKLSSHLNQIKAPSAWPYTTGKGVTVGIVDSGITATNPDLVGKIVSAPNTNFIAGAKTDVRDLNGHGTHVAGIIGAAANNKGVVGVAPGVMLLPIRVASANGMVSASALGQGIRRAAELAPIINVSIGGGACCIKDIQYAVNRGALIIAAAGNSGAAAPIWPARYAKESWAAGRIIAVGAVDQSNRIASWSNRAGDAQNFFLVAPGQWILSTKNNGQAYMSGTSMAAPMVTGAAALVKSRWNFLRAEDVAEVLFRSATDLGAPGTDPIYGRGLLNLEQAMKPIGITYVVNSKGQAVATNLVLLMPAVPYAAAVKNTSIKAVELDEFGRDFEIDLGQRVVTAVDQTLSKLLAQSVDEVKNTQHKNIPAFRFNNTQVSAGVLGTGLKFSQLDSKNSKIEFAAAQLSNPAINLVPKHNYLGVAHSLGTGLTVKAAAYTTAGSDQLQAVSKNSQRSNASMLSVVKSNQYSSLGLTIATVNESASFMGGTMSGLGVSGAKNLTFVTAEAAVEIGNNAVAFAQVSRAQSANNSTSADFSAVVNRAHAIKLGVTKNNVVNRNDYLTVTIEQPLKVSAGKLTTNLAVGRGDTGQLMFENKTINLASSGQETQIRFDYMTVVQKDITGRIFLQFNHNPLHDSTAGTQSIIGFQLFKSF